MYEAFRSINQYLGVFVVAVVLWRGLPMWFAAPRSWVDLHRRLCFAVIVLYGLATCIGSVHYSRLHAPAALSAPLVTVASVLIIGLCLAWPYPNPTDMHSRRSE